MNLEKKELITRQHRGENGKQKSNLYQLYLGKKEGCQSGTTKKEGCQSGTGGVSEWHTEPKPINQSNTSKEVLEQKAQTPLKKEIKKEEYGDKDINTVLLLMKSSVGIETFKESNKQQRMYGKHLVNLGKKIGNADFMKRIEIILNDDFKQQNCNSIKYFYGEMKSVISEKPKKKPTKDRKVEEAREKEEEQATKAAAVLKNKITVFYRMKKIRILWIYAQKRRI